MYYTFLRISSKVFLRVKEAKACSIKLLQPLLCTAGGGCQQKNFVEVGGGVTYSATPFSARLRGRSGVFFEVSDDDAAGVRLSVFQHVSTRNHTDKTFTLTKTTSHLKNCSDILLNPPIRIEERGSSQINAACLFQESCGVSVGFEK